MGEKRKKERKKEKKPVPREEKKQKKNYSTRIISLGKSNNPSPPQTNQNPPIPKTKRQWAIYILP